MAGTTIIMAGISINYYFAGEETEAQKLHNVHKVTPLVRSRPGIRIQTV